MPYKLEPMKETDICQCCSCEENFPYSLIREGHCPKCGSDNWVWGYIDGAEPEEIDQYICAALCFPLRDDRQLIEMVCLHFNTSEEVARTRVSSILNRIRELGVRNK